MTVMEALPLDALNDPAADSPEWEQLREQQRKTGTLPRGTYDATLVNVAIVRRRDTRAHVLRLIAKTDRLGRYVHAWRGLSENPDDPYDLTDGQVKGLRKFADSMGIPTPAPAEQIIEALRVMLGQSVTARVVHTPVGQQATLSREESTITVPARPVTVDLEGRAREAQIAHEKLMEGLQAARYGLACAAEGCFALQKSEGWTALGYESLAEYLAAPEVTLSRSEFYRLVAIWERYVLDGGVPPVALQLAGPSKLEVPLPALEQGVVDAETAVADASSMTRADLRKHYQALLADGEDAPDAGVPEDDEPAYDGSEGELRGYRDGDGASVPVSVARTLAVVLRRVLDEVGRPEQKRMGRELREAVVEALDVAREHALDVDEESLEECLAA